MATVGTVGATGNADIDGLLSGYRWNGVLTYSFPDSPSDYASGYGFGEPLAAGFGQVSAAQQAVVHATMAQVSNYTNLSIQYAGTNGADIRVAQSSEANPTAYAYYPSSNEGGDVWFGTSYNYGNPKLGDYYYLTHVHELGHALGLKHSHEIEGVADVAVPVAHDALEYTVMSYRSYVDGPTNGGYSNETYGYPTTFMMNDIRALQQMYGADFTTQSADTTYSWSASTGEFFIDGVGQGRPGGVSAGASANVVLMTVWDGGGNDTYDFSNYTSGLIVDLNPGSSSLTTSTQRAYLGDGEYAHGNIYNSYLYNGDARSYIENVKGGSGGDMLIGNAVGNRIDGGGGADIMTGGGGNDVFVFRSAYGADIVTDFSLGFDDIDLSGLTQFDGFAAVMAMGGQIGANAVFSFTVGLSLTLQNVAFAGLSQNDFIFGVSTPSEPNEAPTGIVLANAAVNENLSGGVIGALSVTDPDDTAFSFEVSDARFQVAGGPGAYSLKLAAGMALDFEAEPAVALTVTATDAEGLSVSQNLTVFVNDLQGVTITGTSRRDIIDGSRSVSGQSKTTAEADIINAGAGNDSVSAMAGDDLINGGAGDDILYGEAGDDRLLGGLGADRVYGGDGDDVIVIAGSEAQYDVMGGGSGTDTIEVAGAGSIALSKFSAAVSSVEIWDGNGTAVYGTSSSDLLDFSGLQSFSGVSYIDTGSGNDAITGTSGADDLRGGSGNDVIYANAGNDTLTGGAGADTLDGGSGDDLFLFGGLDALLDVMRGGSGEDTLDITGNGSVTLSRFDAGSASMEIWDGNGQGVLGTSSADVLDFSNLTEVFGLSFVDGGSGNDTLTGTNWADNLRGGQGNDILNGGLGNDLLSGGKGYDRFGFGLDFGNDIITDFEAGSKTGDVIAMHHQVFADLETLLAAGQQVGTNVVFTAGLFDSLTLQNTLLGNLHANDFAFV